MPTLSEMARKPRAVTASRSPRMTPQASARERVARSQLPTPIVLTGTRQERQQAEARAKELLQNPGVRRQLREAGIALPPLTPSAIPAAARTSAPASRSYTPQEAMASLRSTASNLRHRENVSDMQAFAVACDQRPDLAEAAGIAGAGTTSLSSWLSNGFDHLVGCSCAGAPGACAQR